MPIYLPRFIASLLLWVQRANVERGCRIGFLLTTTHKRGVLSYSVAQQRRMRAARPTITILQSSKSWGGLPSPGAIAPPSPGGRGNDNSDFKRRLESASRLALQP